MPLDPDSGAITESAEELLRPYLDAALGLTAAPATPTPSHIIIGSKTETDEETHAEPASAPAAVAPLFALFYIEHPTAVAAPPPPRAAHPRIVCTPPVTVHSMPARADEATVLAEGVFGRAGEVLRGLGRGVRAEGDEEGEGEGGMWPPLEAVDEEEGW